MLVLDWPVRIPVRIAVFAAVRPLNHTERSAAKADFHELFSKRAFPFADRQTRRHAQDVSFLASVSWAGLGSENQVCRRRASQALRPNGTRSRQMQALPVSL